MSSAFELLEDGMGTGRDNRNGEGERIGDALSEGFQLRGGGCSLVSTRGHVSGSGTGIGRSNGDEDGEGLFKSFAVRGGGGGGGARLGNRSKEDDSRSWESSEGGILLVGRGLGGAATVNESDASCANFSNLDLRLFTACKESESISEDSIPQQSER